MIMDLYEIPQSVPPGAYQPNLRDFLSSRFGTKADRES